MKVVFKIGITIAVIGMIVLFLSMVFFMINGHIDGMYLIIPAIMGGFGVLTATVTLVWDIIDD